MPLSLRPTPSDARDRTPRPCFSLRLVGLALAAGATLTIPGAPLLAEVCRLEQVTSGSGGFSQGPSADDRGRTIVFESTLDLVGQNAGANLEPFIYDTSSGSFRQLATGSGMSNRNPQVSADGRWVVFTSNADLAGDNPEHRHELFLYDVEHARLSQVTRGAGSPSFGVAHPSISDDGSRISLTVGGDTLGGDPDLQGEIFLIDRAAVRFVQLTSSSRRTFESVISGDGRRVAFSSQGDLTGDNPDGGEELFLWEEGVGVRQLTSSSSTACGSFVYDGDRFTADGNTLLFDSNCNLTGGNGDGGYEVHTVDLQTGVVRQWTSSALDSYAGSLSEDGGVISIASKASFGGHNADGNFESFLVRTATGAIEQLTETTSPGDGNVGSLDASGRVLVFSAKGDLLGTNPERNREIFRRVCVPDPPSGSWMSTPELPGFRFQVRVSNGSVAVRQEADCVGETLCVSGAIPGRSELFLRIVGPKPNGFLWPNVVKFSTSRIEVWIEQTATHRLQYYDLPPVPGSSSELPGLVDKRGFTP